MPPRFLVVLWPALKDVPDEFDPLVLGYRDQVGWGSRSRMVHGWKCDVERSLNGVEVGPLAGRLLTQLWGQYWVRVGVALKDVGGNHQPRLEEVAVITDQLMSRLSIDHRLIQRPVVALG